MEIVLFQAQIDFATKGSPTNMTHCSNGSKFLTVPVPVLELTQFIWRFRVRF